MASENFVARRSETLDAENISEMVSRQTEGIFGRTDVEMVMYETGHVIIKAGKQCSF